MLCVVHCADVGGQGPARRDEIGLLREVSEACNTDCTLMDEHRSEAVSSLRTDEQAGGRGARFL